MFCMEIDYILCFVELCDVLVIVGLIVELVEFEQLSYMLQLIFEKLYLYLFGDRLVVEVIVVEVFEGGVCVFVLFFINFSIFLVKLGLYLEDLYVQLVYCCVGLGWCILSWLVQIVVEWDYGCFEWSVLDWNENVICFYEIMGVSVLFEWCICWLIGDVLVVYGSN